MSDVILLFCMPRGHTKAGIPMYRLLCLISDNPCPQGSVIRIGRSNKQNEVAVLIWCAPMETGPRRECTACLRPPRKPVAMPGKKQTHPLNPNTQMCLQDWYISLFPEESREITAKTPPLSSQSCISFQRNPAYPLSPSLQNLQMVYYLPGVGERSFPEGAGRRRLKGVGGRKVTSLSGAGM